MPDVLPGHSRSDACRLCLETMGKMNPLFSDPSLVATIAETVQLKISEGDGLPSQVCQLCIDQLNSATRFIQRCHVSDAELRLPLYKESGRVTELEVIATDGVEFTVEESNQEGNWVCSLTPVKVELKEELENLPSASSSLAPELPPEMNLKAETVEHPPEILGPLGGSRQTLAQVCGETSNCVIWNVDVTAATPDIDWPTSSVLTEQWSDNVLQSSSEFVCKSPALQTLRPGEWQTNSLEAYNNQMWQQHKTIQQMSDSSWENKTEGTGSCVSLNEVYNSFNFCEEGVFIRSSSDAIMPTTNILPRISDPLLTNHVFGLSESSRDEELFRCYLCSKTFTTHRALSCHRNMSHMQKRSQKEELLMSTPSTPDKCQLWCSLCGSGFSEKEELVRHVQKHKGQSSYCCSRCNKGFHSQQALKVHIKTHAKEKRYKCTKCEKSFSLRSYFRVHELTHKDR